MIDRDRPRTEGERASVIDVRHVAQVRRVRKPSDRARRGRAAIGLGAAVLVCAILATRARGSLGDTTVDPNGRGLQLLQDRETVLRAQAESARRTAATRGLALYRLLRFEAVEKRATDRVEAEGRLGGRAVALATAVLERDLGEVRELRAELDRVRAERVALETVSPSRSPPAKNAVSAARPGFLRPVPGALLTPYGVARDPATGVWIFRAAARFAALPDEIARSPEGGRVVRVEPSIAGGMAIVLAHADAWTSVLTGLGTVVVAPGDVVRRGDPLGTVEPVAAETVAAVRIETWHGRSPVDPDAVLRAR